MPPTQPSLGTLIRIGNDFLFSGEWWITIFPGVALVIMVLSINLLGDWLRDALNPRCAGNGRFDDAQTCLLMLPALVAPTRRRLPDVGTDVERGHRAALQRDDRTAARRSSTASTIGRVPEPDLIKSSRASVAGRAGPAPGWSAGRRCT